MAKAPSVLSCWSLQCNGHASVHEEAPWLVDGVARGLSTRCRAARARSLLSAMRKAWRMVPRR